MKKSIGFALASVMFISLSGGRESNSTPYEIVHFPSGRLTLGGELFLPKGKGPFPAVLYNHGSADGMKSDMASTAMGPLYTAKGWIFFMPYRRGQGLSADAGPYISDLIDKSEQNDGTSAAVKTMFNS